jgi:hypothetical protein
MRRTDVLTKVLAIVGTNLVWWPLVASIYSAITSSGVHRLRFDYLMPAELFPLVLLGGALLLWASVRARSRVRLIGWGLVIVVGALVAGQGLAMVTGLASGRTEPGGWQARLVLAWLAAYTLALVIVGVAGILLLRDLFRPAGSSARSA